MKRGSGLCAWILLVALVFTCAQGCRTRQPEPNRSSARPTRSNPVPTPEKPVAVPVTELSGKVVRVHQAGKFVVVVFPVGQLPRIEQRLGVYREGLKTAEVKFTGPQLDDSIVADIVDGEVREGDLVRN